MACKVQILSPITGEYIDSNLWNQINSEVQDSEFTDKLFAQTRSEQFMAWFGNVYNQGESHSQVITENNEPLLVYHGSFNNFDSFDNSKSNELGFHFGTKKAALNRDINTKPYFLNIRNMIEGVDNLFFDASKLKEEDGILLNYLDEATYSNDFKRLVLAFYQAGKITYNDVNQILSTDTSIRYDGIHGPEALKKALGNPDGYWYKNLKEDEGSISYVVFDPKNIKSLYNNGKFSENENTLYNLADENKVDFTLKIINALQNIPRKIYPSNSVQGFYNDLAKQGAPKNQIEILKDYILRNNIQEINVKDLIIGLASEISYAVEINTTMEDKVRNDYGEDGEEYFFYNGFEYEDIGLNATNVRHTKSGEPITKEEYEEAKQLALKSPAQRTTAFYSDLTVPGGTNYTENEIATPDIVPSIKGHASFSTENGIGWFRSSDKIVYTDLKNVKELLKSSGQLKIDC